MSGGNAVQVENRRVGAGRSRRRQHGPAVFFKLLALGLAGRLFVLIAFGPWRTGAAIGQANAALLADYHVFGKWHFELGLEHFGNRRAVDTFQP